MGDLIYEHHRLVERAAAVEGTPAYDGAYQAARTFAENVLKPAENAWHRSGQTMQIARPVNFETQTGMNLAADRMKTEIKASEKAAAERHVKENAKAAKDVQKSEGELVKAMDKEYAKGAKRPPKTAEQLRKQLAETEPCVL
jgi:phage I-like protein